MPTSRTTRFRTLLLVLPALLWIFSPSLRAQGSPDPVMSAMRDMEFTTGGSLNITRSPVTGLVTFMHTDPSRSVLAPAATSAKRTDKARAFVEAYGEAFGVRDPSQLHVIKSHEPDEVGMEHVRFQQQHNGVPVRGGELTVHLRGNEVVAVNAKTVPDLDQVDTTPRVDAAIALAAAREVLAQDLQVTNAQLSAPELELLNQGLLDGTQTPTQLAWFIEATTDNVDEWLWIDAHTGQPLLHFSQLAHALSRAIYDVHYQQSPATLLRSEGGPATGDADADAAYEFLGDTYTYFFTQHGRDSFDDNGAPIVAGVHFCPEGGWCSSNWSGIENRLSFADGDAKVDDLVAHELSHGVAQHTAGLLFYGKSGVLNEGFADIFGETVDLTNGKGTDTAMVRWLMFEDIPGSSGSRNMMIPNAFGQPGKMSDPQCDSAYTDPHVNNGVVNHAYALMVDGGVYNGFTVTGIGLTKAAKVEYRALSHYLLPTSDFVDNYHALKQACTDLIGTIGITASDCTQVSKALDAVEMATPCSSILGVNKIGTGNGTVTSAPAGISCGTDCTERYRGNTVVVLTTTPAAGSSFAGWSGDPDCSDGSITMTVNKTCIATFNSISAGADLVVSSLTVPGVSAAGATILVTDATRNQGSGSAAASTTKFYLSPNTTFDASDMLLGSRAIGTLTAGATSSATTTLTLPPTTPLGTSYLFVVVDANKVVPEHNETNNVRYSAVGIGPDLIVATLSAPLTGGAGTTITVNTTTKNQGGGAAGSSTMKFYLSTNATLDSTDVLLGSRQIAALAAGATSIGSTALTIPSITLVGTYYLLAVADANKVVAETYETNNVKNTVIRIGPDLIVSALSAPQIGRAGMTMTVTETTKNQGGSAAGTSTTKFYLSVNTAFDTSDVQLGSRAIGILAVGASSTGTTTLSIPSTTPVGTYYLMAVADAGAGVWETVENNNVKNSALRIGPDLIISIFSALPSASAGAIFSVNETTTNQGGSSAGASTTKFYLSRDGTYDGFDVLLGSRAIGVLAAGSSSVGTPSRRIPTGTAAGRYFLFAVSDDTKIVLETIESNNIRSTLITVP